MEVWRAHYDRISGKAFAWDRDNLTNVSPICVPSGDHGNGSKCGRWRDGAGQRFLQEL